MKIKHFPILDIKKIIEHYEVKDGVPVSYVCTTDLRSSDLPVDVFFRETPHPEFGNRYFGLFINRQNNLMICNADLVEELEFGLVENDDGELEYSQTHHDYKTYKNGKMIDGGRAYIRSTGCDAIYRIKNGIMLNEQVMQDKETE